MISTAFDLWAVFVWKILYSPLDMIQNNEGVMLLTLKAVDLVSPLAFRSNAKASSLLSKRSQFQGFVISTAFDLGCLCLEDTLFPP